MPFKSKAQQGYLYKFHPEVAADFAAHTPKKAYKKLPGHVADKKKETIRKDETEKQAVQGQFNVGTPPKKRKLGQGLVAASAVPGILALKYGKGALHAGHAAEHSAQALKNVQHLQTKAVNAQIGAASLAGAGSAIQAFGSDTKKGKPRWRS